MAKTIGKARKAAKKTKAGSAAPRGRLARKATKKKAAPQAGASRALRSTSDPTTLVRSVLAETLGNLKITPAMKLSALGYDKLALAALAARIKVRGVAVDTAAIQNCTTVAEVIAVVAKA
jgi:phosphopantetheine binding protein